jgi:hypothetical protein
MIARLNFKNPRRGKQPRANPFLRAWRITRRKRVAYERAQVCDTLKHLKRQIARMEATAKAWDVPMDAVGPLPVIPELPQREWVEFRQAMGALRDPVKPTPNPQASPATS